MPTPNDQNLLAGCLAQDPALKETFVRRFSNLVFSTIQAVARAKSIDFSPQDLEDLHGTVFLRLFDQGGRKLKQYEGKNGCSLASWIRTITVRLVLDHLRRCGDLLDRSERMVPMDAVLDLADDHPPACEQLAAREQQALVETALQSLAPRDQLTLRLLFFEAHDPATVARMLGISAANVHSVKHRAVQRLKAAVQKRIAT